MGDACLRINSSRESYDNAQHYCKNLNGNIASLTTSKQVDFVLEELKKLQQQDKVKLLVAHRLFRRCQFLTFGLILDSSRVGLLSSSSKKKNQKKNNQIFSPVFAVSLKKCATADAEGDL